MRHEKVSVVVDGVRVFGYRYKSPLIVTSREFIKSGSGVRERVRERAVITFRVPRDMIDKDILIVPIPKDKKFSEVVISFK